MRKKVMVIILSIFLSFIMLYLLFSCYERYSHSLVYLDYVNADSEYYFYGEQQGIKAIFGKFTIVPKSCTRVLLYYRGQTFVISEITPAQLSEFAAKLGWKLRINHETFSFEYEGSYREFLFLKFKEDKLHDIFFQLAPTDSDAHNKMAQDFSFEIENRTFKLPLSKKDIIKIMGRKPDRQERSYTWP